MATKKTTSKKVDTPEKRAEKAMREIEHEHGIDALRAEIDRLNNVVRHQELVIKGLQKANEDISDQLSKARNNG